MSDDNQISLSEEYREKYLELLEKSQEEVLTFVPKIMQNLPSQLEQKHMPVTINEAIMWLKDNLGSDIEKPRF